MGFHGLLDFVGQNACNVSMLSMLFAVAVVNNVGGYWLLCANIYFLFSIYTFTFSEETGKESKRKKTQKNEKEKKVSCLIHFGRKK